MAIGKVRKILYLVPGAIFENYEDKVVRWLDARSQPTQAEIDVVTEQQVLDSELDADAQRETSGVTKRERLLFEINFEQENRTRILEGKTAITKQQYKDAIVNLYKSL